MERKKSIIFMLMNFCVSNKVDISMFEMKISHFNFPLYILLLFISHDNRYNIPKKKTF